MRRSRIKAKPNVGPKPATRSNGTTQKQTPTETTSSKNAEESTDNSAQAENSTTTQKTRSPVKVASPKPTATSPARSTRNENLPKSPGKTVGIENSHKSPGKNAPQTENTTPAPQEKGFPSPPKPSFTTPLTRLQPADETQRSFSELRATPAPSLKIADKSTDPKPRIVGRFGKLKPKPNLTLRARHVSTSENEEESRTKTPTSAPRAPHIAFVEDVEPVVKPLVASVEVPPSPVRHRGTAMDDSFRVPAGVSEDDLYKKPKRRRKYRKIDWGDDPPDKTKFTMSDLIHWNPKKNRMKPKEDKLRKLEEEEEEREEEEEEKEEEEAEKQGEEERSSTPVPQVKIGPDGSIILNEESMVIEQNSPAAEESFINTDYRQEGESDVSYASFRKRCSGKKWSTKETLRFYKALSVVGTDFSLIEQIFKTRTRREIKAKWKREERENRHLIDKALREHVCDFDMSILRAESSDEESEPAAKRRRRSRGSVDSRGSNEGTDGAAKTTGRKGTGRARKKKGVSENPETPTLAPPPVERQTRSTPIPGGPPGAPPRALPDAPPDALPGAPSDAPPGPGAPPDAPSGDAPGTPAVTPGRPPGVPQPALFTPLVSPILRRSENSDQRLTIPLPNQGDLIIVKDKNSAQTPNQQIVHIYMISPPNKAVSNVPLQTLQSFIKPLDSSQNQNLVLNLANLTQGAVVSKSGITGIDKIITSQTGSSSNATGSGSTPSRLVWRTSRSNLDTSQIVGESLRIADLTPSKHGKNQNVSTPNRGGENSNFVQNTESSTNVDNTDCSFSEHQSNERTENTSISVMDISTEPDDLPTFTKSRRAKFVPKLTNLRRTQTELDEEPSTSTDNTVEWTRISVDDFINPTDKSTVGRPSLDVEPVASPSIFDSEPFFQSPPPRTRNPFEFADRVQPIVEELVAGSELYETGRSGSNQGTNVDKNVRRTRDVTEKDKLEGHNSSKVSDKAIESETRNVSEDSRKKEVPSTSSKTYDVRHSNVKEGFVEHVKLYTSSAERKRRDSMISYSSQVSEDAFGGGPQKLVKKQGGGGWRRRKWRKKWKGRRYYNNNSAPKPPKPKPFDYSSFGSPRTMDESYPVAENVEILSEEEDWTGDEVGHRGQRDEVDRQRHGVGGRRGEVVMDRQFRFGESPKETSMGSGELFSNDVSYIKKKSKNTPTKESERIIQKDLVLPEKAAPHTKTSKRTRSEKRSCSERKRMISEGFDSLSEEERTELAKVSVQDPKQAPVFAVLPSPTARILSPVPVPRVLSPRLDESFSDSESGKTRRKVQSPTAILQSPHLQAFGSPTTMPRVSESPISVFSKSVTSSKSQKASGPFSYNPLFFSPPNLVIDEETVEENGGEESPERSSVCHKSVVSSAKKKTKNSDSNEGTSNDSTDNERGTKKNPKASKNGGKGVKSSSVKPTSEESQKESNNQKTKAVKPKGTPTNRRALKNSKSGQVTENDESVDEGQLGRGKSASLAASAAIPQKSGVHEKRQSRSRTKSLRESESEKREITPMEPATRTQQHDKNRKPSRERRDSSSVQNSANDQTSTETPKVTKTHDKKYSKSQDSAEERKDSTTTRDSTKNQTSTVTRESTESSDKQVVASASAQVEERTTASKRRSRVAIKPKLPSNRNSQNVGSAQEKDTSSGGEGVTVMTVAGGPSPKSKSPARKSVQSVEQTTDFTTPRKTRSSRRTSESCDNVTKTSSNVIKPSTDVTMACERRGASTDRPPEMAGDGTGSEATGDSGTSTATGRARRARIAVKPVLSRKRTRSPSKEESEKSSTPGNDDSNRGRKSSRKLSESKDTGGQKTTAVDDATVSTDDVTMCADDVTKSRGSRRQSPAKSRSPRRSKTSESNESSAILSKSKNVMASSKSSPAVKISPSKVVESEESSEIMVHITETKVQISDLDVKSEPTPTPGKQRRSRLTIKPSLGPRKPAASTSEASTPATTSLALPISTTSSVPMTTKPSVTKSTISPAPAASVPIATPRLPLAAFGEEESSSVSMGNLHVALSPVTTKCAEEDSNKTENLRKDDRTLEKSTTRRRAKAKIVPNVPVRRISVEVSEKVREKVSEKVSENVPEIVQSTDSTEEISKKVTPPIAKIGQAVERIPLVSEDSEENDETSRVLVSKTPKIGKQRLEKKKKETMKSPQALRVSELKSRMSNLREQIFEKKSVLPPTTGITPKRVQKPMSERAEKESISQGSKLVVQAQVHVSPTLDSIRKSSLDKFGPKLTKLSDSPSSTGTEEEEESSFISVGNARKLSEKKQNSVSENKPASTPVTSSSTPLTSRTPVQRLRGAKQFSEMRTGFVGGLDLGTRLEGMDTVKNLNLASKLDVNTEDSDETSSITLSSSSKTTISKSSPASTKRRPQPNLTPKRLTTPSSPIATVAMSPKAAGPSIATVAMSPKSPKATNPLLGVDWAAFKGGLTIQHPQTGETIVLCQDDEA